MIIGWKMYTERERNGRRQKVSIKWLEDLSRGVAGKEIETIALESLHVVEAHKGFFQCSFIVPNRATDENGDWHVGAMATLIDVVGAMAIYTYAGHPNVSVDFSISYYSTVKIHEEVEIEAKVSGEKGKLKAVVVEVRRSSGDLVASANQWMASASASIVQTVDVLSKL